LCLATQIFFLKKKKQNALYVMEENHECTINSKCSVICTLEGKKWVLPHTDARVPNRIRKEYTTCRMNQKLSMTEAFENQKNKVNACNAEDDPNLRKIFNADQIETLRQQMQIQFATQSRIIFKNILGQGKFAVVVELCANPALPQVVVVKIATQQNMPLRKEFMMQAKFARVGLAPTPIAAYATYLPFFVMGKVNGTISQLLKQPLSDPDLDEIIEQSVQLLLRMCDHNMTHGDLHFANIGYMMKDSGERIYLCIDFGGAMVGCDPEIDLLQLLRDTFSSSYKRHNTIYLRQRLHRIYESNYGPLILNYNSLSAKRLQMLKDHAMLIRKIVNEQKDGTLPEELTFADTIATNTDSDNSDMDENEDDTEDTEDMGNEDSEHGEEIPQE
jgi:tRNA A-37 threonylcarbamoyl transferase component Bud32